MNLKPIIDKLVKSLNWTTEKDCFSKKQWKAMNAAFTETLKVQSMLEKIQKGNK